MEALSFTSLSNSTVSIIFIGGFVVVKVQSAKKTVTADVKAAVDTLISGKGDTETALDIVRKKSKLSVHMHGR